MAKAKNPKRVAAGKKAWAARMAGTSKKGGNPGKGSGRGSPKKSKFSLTVLVVAGGVAALATAIGATNADKVIGGLQGMADSTNLNVTITGGGIVVGVVALKGAASLWPWFGRKYRGFLAGFGLKP